MFSILLWEGHMDDLVAIHRYENLLLGKTHPSGSGNRKNQFYLSGTAEEKSNAAKMLVRFGVRDLLRWTPQEAVDHISKKIMSLMCFDVLMRYIKFPTDLDPSVDFDYMIALCFPNEVRYDVRRQVVRLRERIERNELKKFPKNIFDGERGRQKAAILLNAFISEKISAKDTTDLYRQFANIAKMNRMLKEYGIDYVCSCLYNTPLEYLHYSLPVATTPEELMEPHQDEFLFAFFQFKHVASCVGREIKKESRESAKQDRLARKEAAYAEAGIFVPNTGASSI